MKVGLFGQRLTLMEELKAATSLAHGQLQTVPFFVSLPACQLPLESYVGQLRALAAIHGALEPALAESDHFAVRAVWKEEQRKLPLLEADLRFFAPRVVADLKKAVEATSRVVERIRLRSLEQPLAQLGCLYVLEGSTLGGVVLRRQYARAFLLAGQEGQAYLNSYGPRVYERWAQFQQRMNSLSLSGEERQQLLAAAGDFFQGLAAVFEALYPFQPESKTYGVTSINPEAGRHPIPDDPRETEASLKAADRCWAAFPYYESRYGERGRRFARSDAAWLATLGEYEPGQVREQVQWLGRVLAARGMPTLLLEAQLDLLFQELVAAVPEKRDRYEKLPVAAAELRAAWQRRVDPEVLGKLGETFDQAVGVEWRQRFPSTGQLLGAAVADELGGHAGAVESLRSWMSDPARFPAPWIAAVAATVAEARARARA